MKRIASCPGRKRAFPPLCRTQYASAIANLHTESGTGLGALWRFIGEFLSKFCFAIFALVAHHSRMVKKFLLLLVFLFVAPASYAQNAQKLTSEQIIKLLKGNSITASEFGCAFYKDDHNGVVVGSSGAEAPFRWGSIEGKYYSSGQCGRGGCVVTSQANEITFSRTDGSYTQKAKLHYGNQCTSRTVWMR